MRKLLTLLTVFVLGFFAAYAQSRTITGKVADSSGRGIDGASIVIKGTTRGTTSGNDGSFTLSVNGSPTLTITALSFRSIDVPTASQTTLSVTLYSSTTTSLSEVVVTTGLGIQRQAKSLGYGTAKLSSNEVSQTKPISVANGLTGKVSGLQINTVNNGLFAPTRITLRGDRSLTGNNQPLIVVDGSIYYSDISTLNPEDIQDYTILKGSSASAVYGSDASNGVIVVNTKKGIRAKPSLTFSTSTTLETISYMPSQQTRFGSNGGESFVNDYGDLSLYIPYENQSYGPEFNGALVPVGRPTADSDLLAVPYSALKNQKKDFFNTGVTTQQNLSFQSGDANGSFFLSLQDIISKAVMPGDKGRRDVFRVGGTKKYGILSANYSLAYTYKFQNTTNTGDVYTNVIETPSHVPLSSLSDIVNNKFATPSGFYNDYYASPYQVIANERNLSTEHHATGNIALSIQPLKWLTLTYRSAIDNASSRYEFHGGEVFYSNYAQTSDLVLYSNPAGTGFDSVTESPKYIAGSDNPHPASYGTNYSNNFLFNSDFLAYVNKDFLKDFNVTGTAGISYLQNKINYTPINTGNLNFPVYNTQNYTNPASISGAAFLSNQQIAEARKLGYFVEATVGYSGAIYLHGSFRTDIDSRLSKDNRWIPYYDVDGAVVLSQLIPSIIDNKVLNFAKLRYAHSVTGNVSALAFGSQYIAYGAYRTTPTLSSAAGFPFTLGSTAVPGYSLSTSIANPNIKPEKVTEDEVGLDLGFLKDRITVGASAYISNTTDGIVFARVSTASGYQSALVNAAKTRNKGIELDLKTTIIRSKNTSWSVGVNWTHEESKVLAIAGDAPSINVAGPTSANGNAYAVINLPYPQIATYDWNRDSATGKVIVNPVTGLPTRSSNLSYLGQATPKDIIGFTSTVTFKDFTLSATADYRGGYKIFNAVGSTMDHSGIGSTTAETGRQRFVFPNSVYFDATKGGYVNNTDIEVNDANWNFWPLTYNAVGANYVISAAAWKLREVVLSYNIPVSKIGNQKLVQRATFSLSGRNLIMIRPSTNRWTDPEFSEDNGNDLGRTGVGQAPPTRFFTGTLSITF